MSDLPFDRVIINTRERPMSVDINQAQSDVDRSVREVFDRTHLKRTTYTDDQANPVQPSGFIGDGLRVRPTSPVSAQLTIKAGLGWYFDVNTYAAVGGVSGMNDYGRYKPFVLTTDQLVTVPTADATNARIDIIEVAVQRRLTDAASRDVFDPVSATFSSTIVQKTLSYALDGQVGAAVGPLASSTSAIGYKTGTPSGSPVAPSTTAGYVKIAEIRVAAGSTTYALNTINDTRRILFPSGGTHISANALMTSPTLAPAMNVVVAPAGVIVAGVGTQFTAGAAIDFYIQAGSNAIGSGNRPTAIVQMTDNANVSYICRTTVTEVTVDSTLQTTLANATTTGPTVAAAIGQTMWKITAVASNGGTLTSLAWTLMAHIPS